MKTKFSSYIVLFSIILSGCQTTTDSLIGTWRFVADQQMDDSNRLVREDRNVDGLLVYSATGQMSAQLEWLGKRTPFMSDTIMNRDGQSTGLGIGSNTWTPEENRAWIDTYDAYFGEYQVDKARSIVTHRINGNLRPEKRNTEYHRHFLLKGDSLFLSSTDSSQRWRAAWVKNK